MTKELKNIKVTIFGKNYTLSTDDNEQDVIKAVQLVDSKMKEIAGTVKDGYTAAVLLSLELAGELDKLKNSLNFIQEKSSKISSLIDMELK